MSDQWISINEAARRLNCSHTPVRRLIAEQRLTVRRLPGGAPRIHAGELDRLVASHTTRPASPAV